jgi:archaeal flagellin N-terminal-like domain
MLGKNRSKKERRGLSNIVGSLLMIVLTIVAALLLGHFAFGLFSSNSHNAQISLSDISVLNPGGTATTASVTVTVTDTGNDPVNITSVTVGGQTLYQFNPTNKNYITLQPGQSYTFVSSNTIKTNPGGGNPTLNVGSTIVVQVTATDTVTGQTLATQASTVVQD